MPNQSSAGSRTLLVFGLITLLSGVELCGERLVDLYGLRPAATLTSEKLLVAGNYDRVRFDPSQLRFKDALYYRTDLQTFSEQDPREAIKVTGPTELAALSARRKELHGVHVVVEDVPLASPPFWVDHDHKPEALRGEAFADRLYAALTGTGDTMYVAPKIVGDRAAAVTALSPRTSFAGTLVALGEADRYDELADVLRIGGRVNPDQVAPYMILDGAPPAPPGAVVRVIPLGPTYNLFVAAPEGVDLATTPAEGTIDKAIDHVVVRKTLRQTIFAVRKHAQEYKPLRFIFPGSAASFRASPTAPSIMHPGGAIFLALGVICSVLGIVWGARRDRSGTEEKLWFEGVVGLIEVSAVVVPALYFLLNRADQPPAPPMGGAPAAIAPAAVSPSVSAPSVAPKEKPEDFQNAVAAVAEIKKATTGNMLAIDASNAEAACAKLSANGVLSTAGQQVCVRERALNEIEAALALLAGKKGEKKALCQLAGRASTRLADAKMQDENDVRDVVAALGKACL